MKSEQCIKIWKPDDLPGEFVDLVGELDDVDWIALVPDTYMEYPPRFLESSGFDSAMEPKIYRTWFGTFFKGAHA